MDILRATPRVPPAHIEYDNPRKGGCISSTDPIQLQAPISVLFRNGTRTPPAILCPTGCAYNCSVDEIWAPNMSAVRCRGGCTGGREMDVRRAVVAVGSEHRHDLCQDFCTQKCHLESHSPPKACGASRKFPWWGTLSKGRWFLPMWCG